MSVLRTRYSLLVNGYWLERARRCAAAKDDRASGAFRVAVASNSGTSPAILLGLIFDPVVEVRRAVASHPRTPSPGLARLAEDADLVVRQGVVLNPATPTEGLKRLSFDRDRNVKREARKRLAVILKRQIEVDRER